MKTLRRELIQRFEGVLEILFNTANVREEIRKAICESLADSALELRGFQDKPAFDMDKAGIEWKLFAGVDIAQSQIDADRLEKETIDAFESAFSINGNWNWYPAKPQEARVWEDFRARLIKIYRADKDAFTKYVTWAAQPYSRGAMTGLAIKKNPQDFPDAWASFCMSTKYKPRQIVSGERTDLDENDIPLSYG